VIASWLTSGWIDVVSVVGWVALVITLGVLVWRRGSETADDAPGAGTRAVSSLAGRAIALLAVGRSLGWRSRK